MGWLRQCRAGLLPAEAPVEINAWGELLEKSGETAHDEIKPFSVVLLGNTTAMSDLKSGLWNQKSWAILYSMYPFCKGIFWKISGNWCRGKWRYFFNFFLIDFFKKLTILWGNSKTGFTHSNVRILCKPADFPFCDGDDDGDGHAPPHPAGSACKETDRINRLLHRLSSTSGLPAHCGQPVFLFHSREVFP